LSPPFKSRVLTLRRCDKLWWNRCCLWVADWERRTQWRFRLQAIPAETD